MIILVCGSVFGLLAAVMAFLMTYIEYSRHFRTGNMAIRLGLEIAIPTLALFMLISLLAAFVLGQLP